LFPILDLEYAPDDMFGDELYDWAISIVQQKTEQKVMLYTGVWFFNKYPALKKLNDLPLWIAIYGRSNVPAIDWKDGLFGCTPTKKTYQASVNAMRTAARPNMNRLIIINHLRLYVRDYLRISNGGKKISQSFLTRLTQ
jgi:hypothetical protein